MALPSKKAKTTPSDVTVLCPTKRIYAAASRSSNKAEHKRYANRKPPGNEDQFCVKSSVQGMFYAAIFDGHGGGGASSYLRDNLHTEIAGALGKLSQNEDHSLMRGEEISSMVSTAFESTDNSLHTKVASHRNLGSYTCKCNYYREHPCVCSKAGRTANEGSTATVVLVSDSEIVCANVGDSEAVMLRLRDTGDYLLMEGNTSDDENETTGSSLSRFGDDDVDEDDDAEDLNEDDDAAESNEDNDSADSKEGAEPDRDVDSVAINRDRDCTKSGKDDDTAEPSPKRLCVVRNASSESLNDECCEQNANDCSTEPREEEPEDEAAETLESSLVSVFEIAKREISCETLTSLHTPIVDEQNSDYKRIRRIAQARNKSGMGKDAEYDGIARGILERYNFVSMDGAHRLNMTRAFGNFGLKTIIPGAICTRQSAVIAKPSHRVVQRQGNDMCLVIGSDGIWDNMSQERVAKICTRQILATFKAFVGQETFRTDAYQQCGNERDSMLKTMEDGTSDADSIEEGKPSLGQSFCANDELMKKLSNQIVQKIVNSALERKVKHDDMSAVVVLFPQLATFLDHSRGVDVSV